MTELLPITYENIDALAASAFAKSRDVATAIREDVLHNLEPRERLSPERLLDRIARRRIFDQEILVEIDVLTDRIARHVLKGTSAVEHFDADDCNASRGGWTEQRRTPEADALSRALMVLYDLQEALLAVHDLMHAERAIEALRLAS